MGDGAVGMILKAKINSKYLDDILAGRKTQEYRQFNGNDIMEVTDETGRIKQLRIKGMEEASKDLERGVKTFHKDIEWSNEAIMVIRVEPIK